MNSSSSPFRSGSPKRSSWPILPVRRADTPIKLVFTVASIEAARVLAAARGGQIDLPEREWQFREFRVCDGHDPEGNVVQLRERVQ